MIQSLHRDHRDIEEILCALERECDVFRRAERPDYELLTEIIDYFRSFLDEYHHRKEDFIFNLTRTRNAEVAKTIDAILAERATAVASLERARDSLRDILNEQRVLRQEFDDAACNFMKHERRQIELEEQFLPLAFSHLTPAERAGFRRTSRLGNMAVRARRLKARLRAQHRWIVREELADQAGRRKNQDSRSTS
jgi:hemerythrin-like domain-containing protein